MQVVSYIIKGIDHDFDGSSIRTMSNMITKNKSISQLFVLYLYRVQLEQINFILQVKNLFDYTLCKQFGWNI